MKKTILCLFVLMLPVILCHAADEKLLPAEDEAQVLTYERLAEDPFTPSEVLPTDAQIASPESPRLPVGLKPAADGEQKLWPESTEAEAGPKKLNYNLKLANATGKDDEVRVLNTKVGAEYAASENTAIGVESNLGIQDPQDAAAWGHDGKEEKTVEAKYKLSF